MEISRETQEAFNRWYDSRFRKTASGEVVRDPGLTALEEVRALRERLVRKEFNEEEAKAERAKNARRVVLGMGGVGTLTGALRAVRENYKNKTTGKEAIVNILANAGIGGLTGAGIGTIVGYVPAAGSSSTLLASVI